MCTFVEYLYILDIIRTYIVPNLQKNEGRKTLKQLFVELQNIVK
jgi:hypothetical protein